MVTNCKVCYEDAVIDWESSDSVYCGDHEQSEWSTEALHFLKW